MSEDASHGAPRSEPPLATRLEIATCLHELRLLAHSCWSNADFPASVSEAMSQCVWSNIALHFTALLNRLDRALCLDSAMDTRSTQCSDPPASQAPIISTAHASTPTDAPVCSASGTADPPSWARQLAAQAWCTPTTSHIVMDPALADAFAAILAYHAEAPVCSGQAAAERTVPLKRYLAMVDAAEMLWTVVANVRDWKAESAEWQDAAARSRDQFFKLWCDDRALVPDPLPCLECATLRAQLAACHTALEAARPVLKHAAVDGSPDADLALDLIQRALDHSPASLGTSADVPGT